ncbi:MAG: hypothetical protein WBR15_03595 [Gammaproteobacteria bacterium]
MTNALCQTNAKPDPSKEYFQQVSTAASKGDVKAQVCLGELYATGIGTQRDYKQAFQWYKKAADSSYPQGKEAIAGMYQAGLGVKSNPKLALSMFHGLVDRGFMPAATDIGMYYMSDDWGLQKDYDRALGWYRKAAAADDPWAEVRIGLMYNNGWGVKEDRVKAEQWLRKAADHKIDCVASFGNLNVWIVYANVQLPKKSETVTGPFGVKYFYHDGRAKNITILHSSGSKEFDDAQVRALRASYFPPWPTGYHTNDKTLGFWLVKSVFVSNDFKDFGTSLRAAIRSAVVMPLHVLIHGSKGTDIATVAFYYLNGTASHIRIVKSSGDKYEDVAAIQAVKDARFPKTPAEYLNQKIHLSVAINFSIIPSQPSASPSMSPTRSSSNRPTSLPIAKSAGVSTPISSVNGSSAQQAAAPISNRINTNLNQSGEQGANAGRIPIRILSTSWNDPNYIRPLRMEVKLQNTSGEMIDYVWLYVSRCAVKGSSEVIPYPLQLLGPFQPDATYVVYPSFPGNYTEFIGSWPNTGSGKYSTHMLITKVIIEFTNGHMTAYDTDISRLLGGGISNFCSSNYLG